MQLKVGGRQDKGRWILARSDQGQWSTHLLLMCKASRAAFVQIWGRREYFDFVEPPGAKMEDAAGLVPRQRLLCRIPCIDLLGDFNLV